MHLHYSPKAEAFRVSTRAFLSANLPTGWEGIGALAREEALVFLPNWRRTLFEGGFLGLAWPKTYGGQGLTKLEQVILTEELARARVPGGTPNDTFGIKMLGSTLLRWGTEEQKRRFLPRILSGEDVWCQGYSEPDAGSDLAAVACRARRDGGEWVLDGQKIWTSNAHLANWIFVLARTQTEGLKHKGISFLLCPLEQPGIDIRPIAMMNHDCEFNETFLTGARTANNNLVGELNDGWRVAMSLLGHERGEEAATNPVLFRNEFDRLVELARSRGRANDPAVRQRLARCYAMVETMRFLGYRILSRYLQDGVLGADASISKLYWSEYHKEVTALALEILGPEATIREGRRPPRSYRTDDPGAPNCSSSWLGAWYNSTAGTIYAGTSEIQRNIIGEMVLGLAKEPTGQQQPG